MCSASTQYSLSDGAPLIPFAASSSHNLSTMTSTSILIVAPPRGPEPAAEFAEAPLLLRNESAAAPLANVILMKSTSRLHFVQRRDAAPMRCGDAMAMRW